MDGKKPRMRCPRRNIARIGLLQEWLGALWFLISCATVGSKLHWISAKKMASDVLKKASTYGVVTSAAEVKKETHAPEEK